MSAYVVEDSCINAVVTYLADSRREWERRQILEAFEGMGTIGDTFEERLGNAMFELNCNAVEQRYGDGQAKEFRDLDYTYKAECLGSAYEVYDRLGQWRYQCSEGDVLESSDLYKALEGIYNSMGHSFFRELRERKDEREAEIRRELDSRIQKLEQLLSPKRKRAVTV